MRIKAFEYIDKVNCFQEDYNGVVELIINVKEERQSINYTKDGSKGLSLQQAQDMLKVLGIELYEDKEINTLEELFNFINDNNLTMTKFDKEFWFAVLDDDGNVYSCWFNVLQAEEKYGVKLNNLN